MYLTRRNVCSLVLIAVWSCMAVGFCWADDSTAHDGLSARWQKAYDAGDAAGVAALYTKQAWLMPPNDKVATGRAAIEAALQQVMTEMPGKLSVVVVDVGADGNLGFARGTYTFVDASGEILDSGKWLEVRTKVEGKWLIDSDMWNSDNPPPE